MLDRFFQGAGSPETVRYATLGTLYRDIVNGYLYRKTSNSGLTGWVQISPPLPVATSTIVQVAWDDADRANGAVGTAPSGQAWRAGLGAAAPLIASKQFTANAGATSVMLMDIPGLEEAGVISYHQVYVNIGAGQAYLYVLLSEGTPSGILLQRGSDRIRVGTQVGGAVTWAQENLIGAPGAMERITLKVETALTGGTSTATIILNGSAYVPVALPAVTLGTSTGALLSGNAVADHWRVLRQEVL